MKNPSASRPRRARGFTLVESLVAMTLIGLCTVGIIGFTRIALKMYYMDRARLMINRDIRTFTAQMDTDAVTANLFLIYPSFSVRSNTVSGVTTDAAVADGEVGDMLVLVYTDPAMTGQGISMVTRLVGYYRQVTDSTLNLGPVRRFDITLATPVNIKTDPMYTLLNNQVGNNATAYPIVTQLAQGLAVNAAGTTPTPALFYNRSNRSIMIDTQISESLTERGSTSQTGNTYNFTVSPRG